MCTIPGEPQPSGAEGEHRKPSSLLWSLALLPALGGDGESTAGQEEVVAVLVVEVVVMVEGVSLVVWW